MSIVGFYEVVLEDAAKGVEIDGKAATNLAVMRSLEEYLLEQMEEIQLFIAKG